MWGATQVVASTTPLSATMVVVADCVYDVPLARRMLLRESVCYKTFWICVSVFNLFFVFPCLVLFASFSPVSFASVGSEESL